MSTQNMAVVEQLFQAFRRMDLEAALALMSDDVIYHNVPFPPDRGKQQARRTLGLFNKLFSQFDVEMKHIVARDNVVLTERVDMLRGSLVDLRFWVCGTFELRDGKITLWRDYFDVGNIALQLATSPLRRLLGR